MSQKPNTPVKYEGYLKKKGDIGLIKGWKNRFFQEQNNKVYYYRSRGDKKSLGFIDISKIYSIQYTKDGSFGFSVTVPGRVYYLQAFDESEREKWIQLFCQRTNLKVGEVRKPGESQVISRRERAQSDSPKPEKNTDVQNKDERGSNEKLATRSFKTYDELYNPNKESLNTNTSKNSSNITNTTPDDSPKKNDLSSNATVQTNSNPTTAAPAATAARTASPHPLPSGSQELKALTATNNNATNNSTTSSSSVQWSASLSPSPNSNFTASSTTTPQSTSPKQSCFLSYSTLLFPFSRNF
jgi:hypothetical protein